MRLPYAWFERRHVGDILSRFTSTEPLVGMLTQGMLAAVVDGLLAMAALVLMLLYSPTLTLIALGALLLSGLLKLAYLQALKVLNVNLITAMAQEQSALVESIRGILSVKTFGQEDTRQRLWQNRLAEAVNAKLRMAQTTAGFDAAQNAILGFETIAFTFVAIGLVMDAQFTVGMLFAFQSFKMHFLGAGTRLIQTAVDWRLNGVHLNRIADIALSEPERGLLGAGVDQPMLTGRIELRNIGWRYGTGEPLVLQQVNLTIEPGETVLLIGPSGGGKTTLMKIMLGLLDPPVGEVLVDGMPLQSYGKAGFRRQIGAIMQDDLLYAGTIAENIAFFDTRIDMDQVRAAARKAAIDADIQQMPMGYETLVGDMGSSLSGGQRQRVMIARALYRQPRIVFADEITASLDPASHERVGEAIASLEATRIIVTHRAFTALPKARLFVVDGGAVRELHLNQEV
jgi:ATP-binding cassette subfamily B protein RaxB